jgi:hypothetical protein
MPKPNEIIKMVNGQIADADDVNDAIHAAGNEGGGIPYDEAAHQRVTAGSESLGSTIYPWGDINVSQDAVLREVDTTSQSEQATVLWQNLRKFIYQKDTPSSYSGEAGKAPIVKNTEDGLEFQDIQVIRQITETECAAVVNSPTGQTTTETLENSEDYTGKRIRIFGVASSRHPSSSYETVSSTSGNRAEYAASSSAKTQSLFYSKTSENESCWFEFEGILTTTLVQIKPQTSPQGTQDTYIRLDGSGYIELVNVVAGSNSYGQCRIDYALVIVYE